MAAYRRYRAALRLALALAQCLNGSEYTTRPRGSTTS
jgi:hypothetical protein